MCRASPLIIAVETPGIPKSTWLFFLARSASAGHTYLQSCPDAFNILTDLPEGHAARILGGPMSNFEDI